MAFDNAETAVTGFEACRSFGSFLSEGLSTGRDLTRNLARVTNPAAEAPFYNAVRRAPNLLKFVHR